MSIDSLPSDITSLLISDTHCKRSLQSQFGWGEAHKITRLTRITRIIRFTHITSIICITDVTRITDITVITEFDRI